MAMLTWIPEVLRDAGLVVVEYPGWENRTTRASGLTVNAVICHHTATGPNVSNTAGARLLANGRSDLKGPLSQLGLDRDGHFWMIAAGRCNHNGYGRFGNDSIGIEAYNDGRGEPWPNKQVDAYQRGCAALISHTNLPVGHCIGHKESDPGRKIDPRGIDMIAFRRRVTEYMEDDMAVDLTPILNRLDAIEAKVDKVYDKIVDENTVRADIRLTREIALKVGVPAP